MKKHWKSITIIAAMVLLCAGSVYYVNGVYLPARKAQRIEALKQTVQEAAPELEESSYKYAVEASEPEKSAYNYTIEVTEATDGDKLTQGSDAAITADVETVETADETADALVKNVPTGNMASGTVENIAGDDGIYHGEQPPTPEPEPEPEPSSTPEPKPSSTPSGSSSGSTPNIGDRKTENGKEYTWLGGLGWVEIRNDSYSEPSKGTHGTSGETETNASF